MTDPLTRPHRGEPLPLDLLNTEWAQPGGEVDFLASPDGVRAFLAEHGLTCSAAEVDRTRNALRSARSAIRSFVEADPIDHAVLGSAAELVRHARIEVAVADGRPQWSVVGAQEPWTLAVRAVVEAIDLVADQPDRIHQCAHPDCVLWFLDTSRRGGRRWHSMSVCGNRAKAQRHYQRHKDDD